MMEGLPVYLFRCIASLASALLLIAAPAGPKTPSAPATQSSSPAQTLVQSAQSTLIHTGANLVLVDVVVTDHGNPVHGLDRARFHVLEDGHEQPIASFDEHRSVNAPAGASTAATDAALPAHTYTNLPAYPPAPSVNVLLLDGLNTPMANQMDVRRRMIQYLGKIPHGTSLAIFTLSSRLRLIEGFTTDAAQLTKVLQSPKGTPQQSVILDPATDQAVDSTVGDMATLTGGGSLTAGGVSALSNLAQFEADITAFQTDLRVKMTLEAMQQLARYLSGIPGRKNVIWFSGSFPIALDPNDAMQDPFEAMRSYSDEIRETAELLSAARVAVYPIDARGLMTPRSLDASYSPSTNLTSVTSNGNRSGSRRRVAANKPSTANDDLNSTKQLMEEQASMQQIAEQTGGREFLNTNGFEGALAAAIENGSSYYTIGYVPGAGQLEGQFRKIQINVDNPGLNLAYRRGYYADPADKPSVHTPGQTSLIVAATLHGAPPSTQILFQARVLPASDPLLQGTKVPAGSGGELTGSLKGPLQRVAADLTVDPHTLHYDLTRDGSLHSQVEFMLVAYDGDGRRINYLDKGFQVNLIAAQIQQTMQTGIRIRLPLDLPAGQFYLRIAVHDLAAERAGSLEVPITVAAN
jgi:VWFA-related protein